MPSDAEIVRDKLKYAMEKIQGDKLFIPPKMDIKIGGKEYASTILLTFANLCVDHGSIILYGGKGTGKTSLAMYIGLISCGNWKDHGYSYLLGDPELRRSQVAGTLDPKAFAEGKIEIIWADFISHPFKILDELNRMSSGAFSYFMSILGSNMATVYGKKKELGSYRVMATMNPPDSGTNKIPPPVLDRFALMIPFSKLPSSEGELILKRPDADQGGEEQIKKILNDLKKRGGLTEKEFYNLPKYASESVKVPDEVNKAISLLVKDFAVCERADYYEKDMLSEVKPPALCVKNSKCRFYENRNFVCYANPSAVSERASLAIKRYSIAVAFLLGKKQVTMQIVKSIAKFMFALRLNPEGEFYEKNYFGSQLYKFSEDMIQKSIKTSNTYRKTYIQLRDIALASNDISKIQTAIQEIQTKFDDPMKYDFIKSLNRKLADLKNNS